MPFEPYQKAYEAAAVGLSGETPEGGLECGFKYVEDGSTQYLGDVDGSGSRVGLDKQYFNQRLNNVLTPYPDRCYDLDGDGTVVGLDKQWMNQLLNNVLLP